LKDLLSFGHVSSSSTAATLKNSLQIGSKVYPYFAEANEIGFHNLLVDGGGSWMPLTEPDLIHPPSPSVATPKTFFESNS
jgi:hypothetical protein